MFNQRSIYIEEVKFLKINNCCLGVCTASVAFGLLTEFGGTLMNTGLNGLVL